MGILKTNIYVCLALALPGVSYAKSEKAPVLAPLVSCLPAQEVANELHFCSDNVDAVNHALDCYDKLQEAWDETAAELDSSLMGNKKRESTRQQGEVGFSESDYKTAVVRMSRLVATTKYDLEVISQYSHAMLDFVGAETEADSSPCYNKNLGRLHVVQKDFEKMIEDGERAIAQAGGLGKVATGYSSGLGGATLNKSAKAGFRKLAQSAPAKAPAAHSPRAKSDITGTQRARDDEIIGEFKMRGQLIGN